MGEIDYKHRQKSADEQEYLDQGKGCVIWSAILVAAIITIACIFCYSVWVDK